MTYKWEAIAQDLTEERDRLLRENEVLRKALETISDECSNQRPYWNSIVACLDTARAALKSEKQ